jgi:hypothetical protein
VPLGTAARLAWMSIQAFPIANTIGTWKLQVPV